MNLVPGNSYRLLSVVMPERALEQFTLQFSSLRLHSNSESLALSKRFSGCMASASLVLQLGLLHMPLCSSGPLEEPSVDGTGRVPGHGLQKEGGLEGGEGGGGALCDGKLVFGLWSKKEGYLHINCLGMLAICLGLHTSLPDLTGHQVLGWIPFLCLTPSPSSYP